MTAEFYFENHSFNLLLTALMFRRKKLTSTFVSSESSEIFAPQRLRTLQDARVPLISDKPPSGEDSWEHRPWFPPLTE